MTKKAYAGIGSRETPVPICDQMTRIAQYLARNGYTLYSGGAERADDAFIKGTNDRIVFTPNRIYRGYVGQTPEQLAFRIAKAHHPAWHKLSDFSTKLMARNSHIILGPDLKSHVRFVVAYAPVNEKGEPQGGTAQGLRIAKAYKIPAFNFNDKAKPEAEYERFITWHRNLPQ